MSMNFTCGQCHHCKNNQPAQVQQGKPNLPLQVGDPNKQIPKQVQADNKPMPKQVGPGNKNLDRPWQKPPQGPGPMVWRPFPGPGFMVEGPKQPLLPVVVGPRPGPGFQVGKPGQPILPVVQQPPPQMGIVRADPGQPLPGWMVQLRPDGTVPPKSQLELPSGPSQPIVTVSPTPPPAILQGGVEQINPVLLEGSKQSEQPNGQESYGELLPSDVVQTPPPPSAPGLTLHDRGLLPTLPRIDAPIDPYDPSARPSLLEVVLRPPPVSDVVAR
jgi:hypothetical protein